jgi:hypothetical protein
MNWLMLGVGIIALRGVLRLYYRRVYPPLPQCECSIHDIERIGEAHAPWCPMFD